MMICTTDFRCRDDVNFKYILICEMTTFAWILGLTFRSLLKFLSTLFGILWISVFSFFCYSLSILCTHFGSSPVRAVATMESLGIAVQRSVSVSLQLFAQLFDNVASRLRDIRSPAIGRNPVEKTSHVSLEYSDASTLPDSFTSRAH